MVYVPPPPPLSLGGWKTVHLVTLLCQRAYLHHFINIRSQPDQRWPDVFVIALLIEAVPSVKKDNASFTGMIFFYIKKLSYNFSCILKKYYLFFYQCFKSLNSLAYGHRERPIQQSPLWCPSYFWHFWLGWAVNSWSCSSIFERVYTWGVFTVGLRLKNQIPYGLELQC